MFGYYIVLETFTIIFFSINQLYAEALVVHIGMRRFRAEQPDKATA
jgi:hypothetical protein